MEPLQQRQLLQQQQQPRQASSSLSSPPSPPPPHLSQQHKQELAISAADAAAQLDAAVDTRSVASKERLLASAPHPPEADPADIARETTSSIRSGQPSVISQVVGGDEGWEALEALKDVSLQALSHLVRRLVDDASASAAAAAAAAAANPSADLSAEQKGELSRLIKNLRQDMAEKVSKILNKGRDVPRAGFNGSNADIDLAQLSRTTLLELYQCVTAEDAPTSRPSSGQSGGRVSAMSRSSSAQASTKPMLSSRLSWHEALRNDSRASLLEMAQQAERIPDGGQVAAALTPGSTSRSQSMNILGISNDSLAPLLAGSGSAILSSADTNSSVGSAAAANGVPAIGEDMMTDHGLALALAALCNGLYQIFDAGVLPQGDATAPVADSARPSGATGPDESAAMYSDLAQRLSVVQNQRPDSDSTELDSGQQALWAECDRLMALVRTICAAREGSSGLTQPPSYEDTLEEAPSSVEVTSGKPTGGARTTHDELTNVLHAIDRVVKLAPRMDNQSVQLNARQQKVMSGAALTALVERLNRGKENFDTQRASSSTTHRYAALQSLVDQITVAGERRMYNQRVVLSGDQTRRMEVGKLGAILDRQAKSRYKNQDSTTREQRLLADLAALQPGLTREYPQFAAQRYEASPAKQRNMFMSTLSSRVDRLADRRLVNQDALSPAQKKEQSWSELERILDGVDSGMGEQRASLTSRKTPVTTK
ncbi:hypothetical protein HDU87_003648 [Geranomyces variabilis]|uniref:NET domain-containing protein n=1 Tax=Geranomyces variabilis TaxID=109894 RepID=A0AAD5TL01_9FUNG|nr:hypothetical protein HDU87_003648 [Geranomyces variabilis]